MRGEVVFAFVAAQEVANPTGPLACLSLLALSTHSSTKTVDEAASNLR